MNISLDWHPPFGKYCYRLSLHIDCFVPIFKLVIWDYVLITRDVFSIELFGVKLAFSIYNKTDCENGYKPGIYYNTWSYRIRKIFDEMEDQ
jgi:hypothetical protein